MSNVKDSEFYANLGLHSLSRFNFHSSCMTPRSFRAFHFSIRLIRSKKAAAGICGWPQCELGLFLGIGNYRTENDMSKLLSTGPCGLHTIHGCFKTRTEHSLETQESFESLASNLARLAS